MKFRLLILLTLILIPLCIYGQKNSYIGYKYVGVKYDESLPNGVRDLGGSLLENDKYGVTRVKKGNTDMLWLARITSRNSAGVPHWQVRDVLVLPALKKNQEILQGLTFPCTINKKEDLNLIVLADYSPRNKIYRVNRAWRANTRTNKFQMISTRGIICQAIDS